MLRQAVWLVLTWQLAGCSSDGGSKEDSGLAAKDAAASTAPDAGTRAPDAMMGHPPARDAGTPPRDAGTPPRDAAAQRDAGPSPMPRDAAASGDAQPADAGSTPATDASGPVGKTCVGTNKVDAFVSDPKLCVYERTSSGRGRWRSRRTATCS